jgi:hypothetical protein
MEIRWCPECGAIVIDIDSDNRTFPGRIMKMKFPKISKCDENRNI